MKNSFFRPDGLIRIIFFLTLLLIIVPVSFAHSSTPAAPSQVQSPVLERKTVVSQADLSYENSTLTEDITWRGTVLVRGFVVIAPQATLRIEPGTVIRFMKSPILRQPPRLVIMGRVQCSGSAEKPVFFGPNLTDSAAGDWGGILLLSTEKRNLFEQVRVEGAETGIDSRFSVMTGKGITIARSRTGMVFKDSAVHLEELSISECETGLDIRDSEFDLREGILSDNQRGIFGHHSSLVLASLTVRNNARQGIHTEECRIKFTSCEVSGNTVGALVKGGEGQILMSRFLRNREAGLQLSAARIRVNRTLFADNIGDGIRTEDGRSIIWGSLFTGNGGLNLLASGSDSVSAVLNWWGSVDEAAITSKLSGPIIFLPWLNEKPLLP